MCWPTRISISPPWSARPERVRRGNAEGNARSAECSPLATVASCSRAPDVGYAAGWARVCNRALEWDFRDLPTGGGLCRPSPRASSTRGGTTQRGRERPPSDLRQDLYRLTPQGRSRPRSARVDPLAMRPVMSSAHRPVMTPAVNAADRAPSARYACGTETIVASTKEPLCH